MSYLLMGAQAGKDTNVPYPSWIPAFELGCRRMLEALPLREGKVGSSACVEFPLLTIKQLETLGLTRCVSWRNQRNR